MSARSQRPGGGSRSRIRAPAPASSKSPPARPVPLLEWLVAALGALLVAAAIGHLGWRALWRDATPPDVSVAVERVLELEEGFLVQFRARNRGGEAAAEVVIEGELAGPNGPLETGEATLDQIAPRSDREGGLFFVRDPREFELRLRAKGYAKP